MNWYPLDDSNDLFGRDNSPDLIVNLPDLKKQRDKLLDEIAAIESYKKPTTDKDLSDKEAIEYWNEHNVTDHILPLQEELKKVEATIKEIQDGNTNQKI